MGWVETEKHALSKVSANGIPFVQCVDSTKEYRLILFSFQKIYVLSLAWVQKVNVNLFPAGNFYFSTFFFHLFFYTRNVQWFDSF